MQYSHPLVAETASAISSFVSASSRPGRIAALRLSQTSRRSGGWLASVRQKFGTRSIDRVFMMSSYTARTSGDASPYSTIFTVGMMVPPRTRVSSHLRAQLRVELPERVDHCVDGTRAGLEHGRRVDGRPFEAEALELGHARDDAGVVRVELLALRVARRRRGHAAKP